MNDIQVEERILNNYMLQYSVAAESYKMMGKMLDEQLVRERLEMCGMQNIYVYGGTFLAVQLCRAVGNNAKILGIVDKAGRTVMKTEIPVITLEDLKKTYTNEKIIVTPPMYYSEIKSELQQFIEEDNIWFLGEFLYGLL